MKRRDLASQLDRLIRIERPVAAGGFRGAGSGTWALVDEVFAGIEDLTAGRTERADEGINFASRPARVRLRYRTDLTPNMRFVEGDRVMQIVGGPAESREFGRREAVDFLVEDYRPAGNPA